MNAQAGPHRRAAIGVVEIIIVVIILGVIASLAIPRFSSAAVRDEESLLKGRLRVLRTAIALYERDHGVLPGRVAGQEPLAGPSQATLVVQQLTRYTDKAGNVSSTPDESHTFGPYLRDGVPACPVAATPDAGTIGIRSGSRNPPDTGWLYDPETGFIVANSSDADASGIPYASY